jgi:hypothetical protein
VEVLQCGLAGLRGAAGLGAGHANGGREKLKWMRWRTFERLAAEHDRLVGRAMMLKFGRFRDFLE